MQELSNEIENYLRVCTVAKGLSPLTLKAYKIDFKQFSAIMDSKDCFSKECLSEYIEHLHRNFKPKSAKRKVACIKAFYHYMEMEDIIEINPFHKIKVKYKEPFILPKIIPLPDVQSSGEGVTEHMWRYMERYTCCLRVRIHHITNRLVGIPVTKLVSKSIIAAMSPNA